MPLSKFHPDDQQSNDRCYRLFQDYLILRKSYQIRRQMNVSCLWASLAVNDIITTNSTLRYEQPKMRKYAHLTSPGQDSRLSITTVHVFSLPSAA